tara:strand:- start:1158 stop:1859 length:702 start_codon:yes stop_codon:yes gene_type:complete
MNNTDYVIKCNDGLCNRLRVIFSYLQVANMQKKKLIVIWIKNASCDCHFLDFFEPIQNVTFVNNTLKRIVNYSGNQIHPRFIPNYSLLKLNSKLRKTIYDKIELLERPYAAIHVRRTDHLNLLSRNKNVGFTSDSDFDKFIESNGDKSLYIATDNKNTYDRFCEKYSDKVRFPYHKNNPNNFRHTNMHDSVVDMFVCIYADNFMGTYYSSFSDLIDTLRKVQKKDNSRIMLLL